MANTLRKQLAPETQQELSTGQTVSLFNEKKTSRFLSSKDDLEEDDILKNPNLLSQSVLKGHQKKNSL